MIKRHSGVIFLLLALAFWSPAQALAAGDFSRAVIQVVCDQRLGTGAVTDAAAGFIVTAGHVVIDPETGIRAESCHLNYQPDGPDSLPTRYAAEIVRAVFDNRHELDFAVLKATKVIDGPAQAFADYLPVDVFTALGQSVTIYGYPAGNLSTAQGTVSNYSRGQGLTDAVIKEGFSGGPVVSESGGLIGVANKVFLSINEKTGQETPVDYEFGDSLSLINWLDGFGAKAHELYLKLFDAARFGVQPYFIRDEKSGCRDLARTAVSPTVYCLLAGDFRLAFPDEGTYFSWYQDYSGVKWAQPEDIAKYRLIGNVTYQAGSLMKLATDPTVYLVTDSIGTLRRVPSEARAVAFFGNQWAKLVHDLPDVFFTDYSVHEPLP